MKEKIITAYYEKRGLTPEAARAAVEAVNAWEAWPTDRDETVTAAGLP